MGSGGRAIGLDGKPLKQQPKKNVNPGRMAGRSQTVQPMGMTRPMQQFASGRPGPYPMMGGMGPRMGPGGPPFPTRMPFPGSAPDPTGSYGFFSGTPQMTNGGNGTAPSAVVNAPNVAKVAPNSFNNQVKNVDPARGAQPPTAGQGQQELVGEVPGFGTNSNIHELFGKMVWRKMEGLRDQAVVDRLQNRIMNLIHDALSDQTANQNAVAAPGPGKGAPFRRF